MYSIFLNKILFTLCIAVLLKTDLLRTLIASLEVKKNLFSHGLFIVFFFFFNINVNSCKVFCICAYLFQLHLLFRKKKIYSMPCLFLLSIHTLSAVHSLKITNFFEGHNTHLH